MRRILDRPLALLGAVVTASLLSVSPLAAQCIISGPSVICSGSARLCAPEGNWAAEWIGPNGFSSTELCVTVSEPGTYQLFLYDLTTGGGAMCEHTLSIGTPPTASITGPSSACTGASAELCGPDGNFVLAWTMPGGSTANSRCIAATVGGSYALTVTDPATGCVSEPALHDLAFASCDTTPPPPPPPPPGISVACPRTASFWSAQCRETNGARRRISGERMSSLGACIDQHAAAFAWSGPSAGLCDALKHGSRPKLRARTVRQFAAVVANVCAADMGMTVNGAPIGVDAGQALAIPGAPATVGEWLSQADAQLMTLAGRDLDEPGVTDAYRAILRAAWLINHGDGLVASCPTPAAVANGRPGGGFDDVTILEPDDRSLAAALDEAASALRLERPTPNPFRMLTHIAYTLDTDRPSPVRIVVHDLAGRAVRVLTDGVQAPGSYELSWDGRADDGRVMPGGVYFVHASTGSRLLQSRLTLLR